MQKIMFSDKFGLTKAVLEGRKTMTRRIAEKVLVEDIDQHLVWIGEFKKPKFKVGEVVAVAQSYKDAGFSPDTLIREYKTMKDVPGWTNKMFVEAQSMRYFIRITNIQVERLQDISDEDCFREGVRRWKDCPDCPDVAKNFPDELYEIPGSWDAYLSPRKAFAALIDKVSGKGTWDSNPWVFVYEFELVKCYEND